LTDTDRRHIKLPRIGTVRTHESTRELARHVERGTARIRSATVSFRYSRWFVSFSVQITRDDPPPVHRGMVVGVDLGVKLRRDSPMETHVRPAPRGQRVPPREDPLGQRRHRKVPTQDTPSQVS